MSIQKNVDNLSLGDSASALSLLYMIVEDAITKFPQAFGQCHLPSSLKDFRSRYSSFLPAFEAARLASPERAEVAKFMAQALQDNISIEVDGAQTCLANHLLRAPVNLPSAFSIQEFSGDAGWHPALEYREDLWPAAKLGQLGHMLASDGFATVEVATRLEWLVAHGSVNGVVNLEGRKIAVLGAGAEMAPTRYWLEAGADVLWLDMQPPPTHWHDDPALAGRLFIPDTPANLLNDPMIVRDQILAFAGEEAVDLGLYAYAPGQARELKLTASMNAIVDSLPAHLIRSITLLVSPTTPTELSSADQERIDLNFDNRPWWANFCRVFGLLEPIAGASSKGGVSQSIVEIQGASYQAAQYLGKILTAESWANFGQIKGAGNNGTPLRVSANTAAITRTKSLDHPVFAGAFLGASAFGVDTLSPAQSSQLNGLLALADWLDPNLPTPGRVRVHGGIHTLPYVLNSALTVAAAFGMLRRPRLLLRLLTG